MKRIPSFIAVLALMVVAGCGKKPAPEAVVPVAEPQAERNGSDDEARRRAEEEARRRAAEEEARRARTTLEEMVFFDYDESALRNDSRAILDAKLPILRADPSIRIRIEGHADDRGSTEYNLALGMRRAETVRDYLVGYGIAGDRLSVASYGEERPLVTGSGEQSWARNRRGEFAVSGGPVVAGAGR